MRNVTVKRLFEEVLGTLPKPHTPDVIEDVFCAIEANPAWRRQYDELQEALGKSVVNAWGGFWVAHVEGRTGGEHVPAKRSSLLESYSRLPRGGKIAHRKVKEPDALKAMSEYFYANRESLPATIREHRVLIVELIKAGLPPAEAFEKVREKPAFAR